MISSLVINLQFQDMTMEQEILSWLNAKYETGNETDFISKEALWNEFANERDVNLSRLFHASWEMHQSKFIERN